MEHDDKLEPQSALNKMHNTPCGEVSIYRWEIGAKISVSVSISRFLRLRPLLYTILYGALPVLRLQVVYPVLYKFTNRTKEWKVSQFTASLAS